MKDNKASRSKRGLTIINLIQTNAGYSIIQGTELLNKAQNQVPAIAPASVAIPSTFQTPVPIIKQQPKMTVKQNNLLFLKSSTCPRPTSKGEDCRKLQQKAKQQCKSYASWFNFNQISEFQKNQVRTWISEWNLRRPIDEAYLNEWLKKYKQHRNIIIEVYYASFLPNKSYMSASSVRKYICEDARWLMKIHLLLTSWGIINANKINFDNENFHVEDLYVLKKQNKYDVLNLQSSYYSKQAKKETESDSYSTLKKITNAIRPYCDYCGVHCQIVWFQHLRVMDPKQINSIMKNVNSKNPPLSEKQYEIILCTKCYCNGNFPLLLTHHDFRKISLNDRLEPGKRKKTGKNKRKQKKRRMKQKQLLQQDQDFKQQIQEAQDDAKQKQKQKQKEKEKQKQKQKSSVNKDEQQNQNSSQKQQGQSKDLKLNNGTMNGIKQVKQTKQVKQLQSENKPANESQKQPTAAEIIQQVVNSVKPQRIWSFQQTKLLLQLVEIHGEDWDTIYQLMRKQGYCMDCNPQDLIFQFIKLPQMNISSLGQQYNNESFVNQNKHEFKSNFLIKKIQRNYDNAVKLHELIKQKGVVVQKTTNQNWKELLNKFIQLYITKISMKLQILSGLKEKAIKQHRKYEKTTKQFNQS